MIEYVILIRFWQVVATIAAASQLADARMADPEAPITRNTVRNTPAPRSASQPQHGPQHSRNKVAQPQLGPQHSRITVCTATSVISVTSMTSWHSTGLTPHTSVSRRAVVRCGVMPRIGARGRSRAMRRAEAPELV